eukprot:3857986-Prymnesium_polylepis.1
MGEPLRNISLSRGDRFPWSIRDDDRRRPSRFIGGSQIGDPRLKSRVAAGATHKQWRVRRRQAVARSQCEGHWQMGTCRQVVAGRGLVLVRTAALSPVQTPSQKHEQLEPRFLHWCFELLAHQSPQRLHGCRLSRAQGGRDIGWHCSACGAEAIDRVNRGSASAFGLAHSFGEAGERVVRKYPTPPRPVAICGIW